ncbi:MAG: FAD-binding domain-containing protein [Pseudomonadota bacterium]
MLILLHDPDAAFFIKNLAAFLSRLAWRCHFIQKLEQQPSIEFFCMHSAFEGMREPHFREDFFEAWKSGNTGYPLIDACMRSLHANGWITFRMRAMLVSFASYHLWLDWRKTAPYLATLFTDYEAGIHYSQFQMQSGVTGINAIRIYNPVKQSLDNDKDGKFIRLYVPELEHISNQWIHEPWRLDEGISNYTKPIVDHDIAIKYARAEISKIVQSNAFHEEAKAVYNKLGSRNRPIKAKKKTDQKMSDQLSLDI